MRVASIQPPLGTPINAGHPLSKGLVGCYNFSEDGGMILTDSSLCSNHGSMAGFSLSGTTSNWGPSSIGTYLDFANTDQIDIPHDGTLNFTAFSISFWLNMTATTGYIMTKTALAAGGQFLIYLNNPSGTRRRIWSYVQTDGINWVQRGNNDQTIIDTDHNDGKWHHFVCTCDASFNMRVYKDGMRNDDQSQGAGTVTSITNTTVLQIGHNTTDAGAKFVGKLSAIRLYNRVLSESEVRQLYIGSYSMFFSRPSTILTLSQNFSNFFQFFQ